MQLRADHTDSSSDWSYYQSSRRGKAQKRRAGKDSQLRKRLAISLHSCMEGLLSGHKNLLDLQGWRSPSCQNPLLNFLVQCQTRSVSQAELGCSSAADIPPRLPGPGTFWREPTSTGSLGTSTNPGGVLKILGATGARETEQPPWVRQKGLQRQALGGTGKRCYFSCSHWHGKEDISSWKPDPGATSATMGTAVVALWGWLSSRIPGWQSEKPLQFLALN